MIREVKKLMRLYINKKYHRDKYIEISKKLKKYRKRKIKLYLLKNYVKIYRKYKYNVVDMKKLKKLFKKKRSNEISQVLEEMCEAKLLKRIKDKKNKKKSLYVLNKIKLF